MLEITLASTQIKIILLDFDFTMQPEAAHSPTIKMHVAFR